MYSADWYEQEPGIEPLKRGSNNTYAWQHSWLPIDSQSYTHNSHTDAAHYGALVGEYNHIEKAAQRSFKQSPDRAKDQNPNDDSSPTLPLTIAAFIIFLHIYPFLSFYLSGLNIIEV